MACEARIVRVLRALEYPSLEETTSGSSPNPAATTLDKRPDELARIVSWLEDRKVNTEHTTAPGMPGTWYLIPGVI